MTEFEILLNECKNAVDRFVWFKLSSKADADDVLQDTYLTTFQKFDTLADKSHFKAWIISIARNKCNDYYRRKAKSVDVSIDELTEQPLTASRYGYVEQHDVYDTLESLSENDKQIINLFYIQGYNQSEISQRLNIPIGTVKSRLYTARNNFKRLYLPDTIYRKVDENMKKLPEIMPEYTITKLDKEPFSVKWEELMGWFIVPKLGEKLNWAIYDVPKRNRTEYDEMQVVGKAEIHGIEGVEIAVKQYTPMDCNKTDNDKIAERTFIAQLTDTHCRFLAESHISGGVKKCYTFLDGDEFIPNWGFGENNCGNEVNLSVKGDIIRNGSEITAADKPFLLDVVGRYEVKIGGKSYDTICVMDIETYDGGVVSEQYLDKNGRTILWRRFNRNDWAKDRYKKNWTEILPENERITVNGEVYVHWYNCITDYIL
ncbi:MAG: sigma-70 family RNA polymerase sigma factor [Oscillospiraceae bacterium]|jgi:RNA polymerase sigma factor (sigma-70 family)|nr:sigma-70 family RNA polymerase sigma factor [Oscillospiraceae bacterium]